ncbi:MAG: DUF4202 family protein [Candidatus Gottesmanbacteria bacterium]
MLPELARNQTAEIFRQIINESPQAGSEIKTRQERELGHAADVANWIIILSPDATLDLQVAGWLHDCERLVDNEGTVGFKGDRTSPEYLAHKKGHAKRSADLAKVMLQRFGFSASNIDRTYFLILHHDDTGEEIDKIGDEELTILAAADSLSFFTFIAADMLQREGESRLQDKANFMVDKMSSGIRKLLGDQQITDPTISRVKNQALAKYQQG